MTIDPETEITEVITRIIQAKATGLLAHPEVMKEELILDDPLYAHMIIYLSQHPEISLDIAPESMINIEDTADMIMTGLDKEGKLDKIARKAGGLDARQIYGTTESVISILLCPDTPVSDPLHEPLKCPECNIVGKITGHSKTTDPRSKNGKLLFMDVTCPRCGVTQTIRYLAVGTEVKVKSQMV